MNEEAGTCPECGGGIPANAPQGLCPQCLMAGVAAPTETGTAPAGSVPPAPSVASIAQAFPQLQIIGLIGRGGMGYVYRARQPKLERDVALKILPRELATQPGFAGRFEREGRLLAKLSHPNIVSIFDFGESGGYFHLLMEYVDGVNLRQAMRASRFTPAQALSIVPAICEALQFAHDEGVLHRDVKPENILIDAKGRVKIADFGIAKLMERGATGRGGAGTAAALTTPVPAPARAAEETPGRGELTAVNGTLGTPQYMAPEQLERPAEVDHRADIYSLGVVFYELLTGELPVGKIAPPSAKTPLDKRVDEIVLRALAKEREQRQQSAGQLKTEVETVVHDPGGPARATAESWRPAAGTAAAGGVALYFTGMAGAVPLVEGLRGGYQWLLTITLAWGFAVVWYVLRRFGNVERERSMEDREGLRSWIENLSVVATIMCLPVCGLGIFFLGNLIDELTVGTGGWNPALSEALLVPQALLGLGLLPWAAWRLRRSAVAPGVSRRRTSDDQPMTAAEESLEHKQRVSVFLACAGFVALLLGMFNPWGSVAWKWYTVACVLGWVIIGLLNSGSTHSPSMGRTTGSGRSRALYAGLSLLVLVVAGLVWVTAERQQRARAVAVEAHARAQAAAAEARALNLDAGSVLTTAGVTIDSVPPVVVYTQPLSGAREVEPGVTEIHVRFSTEMAAQSWSWSEAWAGSTPAMIGTPWYDTQRRVCSLKVKLEPGRTYAWWLNSEQFTNFKDTNGKPAVPYLLIFETRAASNIP